MGKARFITVGKVLIFQTKTLKILHPKYQSPRLYQLSSIEKYTNKINYHAGFQIFLGPMGPTSD